MATHTLILENWTPVLLNSVIGNRWALHKAKQDTAALLKIEALNQDVPRATGKRRLALHVSGWARGGNLPDKDAMEKVLLDACVLCGLLLNDDAKGLEDRPTITLTRGPKRSVLTLTDVE